MNDFLGNGSRDQKRKDKALPPAEELLNAVKAMPAPVFGVIDGAKFGNVVGELEAVELPHRSLFLDHADKNVEAAAGWLVTLENEAAIKTFVELTDGLNAAVFWSCKAGEMVLFRHLRTINLAIVPLSQGSNEGDAPVYKDTRVMFRHYDPTVMAQILPVLDEAQFARVMGPGEQITLYAKDYGGVRVALKSASSQMLPAGPLTLRPEQMAEIEEIRAATSRRETESFLRQHAPEQCSSYDDRKLSMAVAASEKSALSLGIESERGQVYWAYLMVSSNGKIAQSPPVTDYLSNPNHTGSPDEKVMRLMEHLSSQPSAGIWH